MFVYRSNLKYLLSLLSGKNFLFRKTGLPHLLTNFRSISDNQVHRALLGIDNKNI